jgi:hypothetical protein
MFKTVLLLLCLFLSSAAQASEQGNDANLVIDIIECESGGKYNAIGDDGVSVGIAQFQKITFEEMKHLAKMPKLRWKNPIDQLRLMVWMLNNGHGKRWTCYRKIMQQKKGTISVETIK